MTDHLPLQPSLKDTAEFVRLMLQRQRITVVEVVHWADSIITSLNEPPTWSLDLAMCQNEWPDEVDSQLQKVPGCTTDDLPRKMMASILCDDWLTGRATDQDFIREWYGLYPEYPVNDEERHAADIWQYLDEVFVSIYSGDRMRTTLAEARAKLTKMLEPYAQFKPLVEKVGLTRKF